MALWPYAVRIQYGELMFWQKNMSAYQRECREWAFNVIAETRIKESWLQQVIRKFMFDMSAKSSW